MNRDSQGRDLYGISADVSVNTHQLTLRGALLTSARFMRDFNGGYSVPPNVQTQPVVNGNTIHWQRNRVDGAPGYALVVQVIDGGTVSTNAAGSLVLNAAHGDNAVHLRVLAWTGERPLTPITHVNLFNNTVNPDTQSQNVVEFLSYQDKLLAGSWQYDLSGDYRSEPAGGKILVANAKRP